MQGDALCHLVVESLRRGDISPRRGMRRRPASRRARSCRSARRRGRRSGCGQASWPRSAGRRPKQRPDECRPAPPSSTQNTRLVTVVGHHEMVVQIRRESAMAWLSGCGAPTMCGATISATPISDHSARAAEGDQRQPGAVAMAVADPPGLPRGEVGGGHRRQFRRQPEAGRKREHGESPQGPRACPDASRRCRRRVPRRRPASSAKPIAVTTLASVVKANRSKPSAGAQASASCSCGLRRRRGCMGAVRRLVMGAASLEGLRLRGSAERW